MPDLITPTRAGADYMIVEFDPTGAVQLATLDNYALADYVLNENEVGVLTLNLPDGIYDPTLFVKDCQFYVFRRAPGATNFYLEDNAVWLLRKVRFFDDNQQRLVQIIAEHGLSLLGRRVVPYNEGNAYTLKLDEADDLIKAIARENMGTLATDTARDLSAYLSIPADVALAPILKKEISNRTLLDTFKEIAEASFKAGTWLGFNIVVTDPTVRTLQLQTYITTADVDRRASSGNPLLIGPDFGNLENWAYEIDWTEEANFIYAGGPGDDFIRPVATSQDSASIAASPFARAEQYVDASSSPDATSLQDAADSALRLARPRHTLSGVLTDHPQARYGIDWRKGTLVTGQARGIAVDYRISQVHVTLEAARETIAVTMRSID